MDTLIMAAFIAAGVHMLNLRQQRRRIGLLARHLANYQIEKLMENLLEGYLRALGEKEEARRDQIWQLLRTTEQQLAEQFQRFAAEFSQVPPEKTRVSRIPVALPFALQLFPAASFDLRQVFVVHAQGIARGVRNDAGLTQRDKAFTLTAELLLMQHTCHWFCKSKTVASARMVARHRTPHQQLVESVSPETRRAYLALVEA
ncbi:hypothetical protein C8241_16405 [Paracidovorax avenae]|uniref:hypothetical protein n=1 Tax=Paracidovorax avenae TaxID=80867 RepID=UPI000D158FC4|nr:MULTISPECIES: hypothetical protein [Comamonadaceae]AVS63051.1 hypothetical protein C8241_16405 [Paracidovorax avenae]AVS66360.1 hypothetical protein C8245_12360 [Paracidovorax avenae]AVS71531.1 hypothetical protein C8247_14555 [Paracidovorax avenae]AVS78663.1 hypothetical protein C8234_11660 [Paracidovorax avenae]AVS82188.1 hypothetical protein C8237_14570 [Paracidovorax avenae]